VIRERKDIAGRIRKIYRRGKWPASDAWAQRITEVVIALDNARSRPRKPKRRHHGRADDMWSLLGALQPIVRAERERLRPHEAITLPPYDLVDDLEKVVTKLLGHSLAPRRRRGRPPADWYFKPQALARGLSWSLEEAGRKASFTNRNGPGVRTIVELLEFIGEYRTTYAVWHALRQLRGGA
jgi:hypothetical protein